MSRHRPSFWQRLHQVWLGNAQPIMLLLVGLAASLALSLWVARSVDRQVEMRFQQLSDRPVDMTQQRFSLYAEGLYSMRGVFAAQGNRVSHESLQAYSASRPLLAGFPGTTGWGFSERLHSTELAGRLTALRQEYPEFQYRRLDGHATPVPGEHIYLTSLVEPLPENRFVLGLDLASEPRRRQAADLATDSGQPTLSAPIHLVTDSRQVIAMLFFLPVYATPATPPSMVERRQQLVGWVTTPLRATTVFDFLDTEPDLLRHLDIRVSDVTNRQQPVLLHTRETEAPEHNWLDMITPWLWLSPPLSRSVEMEIGGRTLRLDMQAHRSVYTGIDQSLPWLTLMLGALGSLLVAGLLWFYASLRREAEDRAFQMTTSLRERESLLKSTLASLDDWVFVFNADGTIIDCHEPSRDHHWLPRFSFLGHRIESLEVPPAVRRQLQEAWVTVRTRGKAFCEFSLPLQNQLTTFSARLTARLDNDASFDGVTMVCRDISMERLQARQLHESEEKFRLLFAEAAEPIVLIKDGRYHDANPAALQLHSSGKEELIGKEVSLFAAPPPAGEPTAQEKLTAQMTATVLHGPQHFDWDFQLPGSHDVLPSEWHMSCIELGGEPYFLAAITDLAARKQTEAALIAARDAAEAATREKSEFLATMSHEIRTPMNGVLGMAQLLMGTELNVEQHDYARTLYHSGQALLGIINDILDFSKIEAGHLGLESVPFDLQAAVEETCELLLPQIHEKNLKLDLELDAGTPFRVIGDPGRLRQVLLNYLSNAVKFTLHGGIRVQLQTLEETATDCLLELTVADTGIGIAPEQTNLLFQRFSQADASTTRRFGGTGLGLAISKALVERMNGTVSVVSEPGQGSTFRATFRLLKDASLAQPLLPTPELADCFALVLDPDHKRQQALAQQLQRLGLQTITPTTTRQALQEVAASSPDFIFLDAALGDTAITDFINTLRQTENGHRPKLLYLSPHPGYGDHAFCRQYHIAAYLPRPARPEWLAQAMSRLYRHTTAPLITRQQVIEWSSSPQPTELAPLKKGLRVLLAEDNAVNQKVASRMLEKLGCKIDSVANGQEAVSMASQFPYDIILMDVHMPEMDGLTASRILRARGIAHPPIIALTANSQESDRRQCLAAGMNDFLAKPVRLQSLYEALQRWS